jgi:hypothetical protein
MAEEDEEQRLRLPQRGQPDTATVAGGQLDIGGRVADLERQMKPSPPAGEPRRPRSLRARSGRKARVHAVDVAGVEAGDVVGRWQPLPAMSMRETIRRAGARCPRRGGAGSGWQHRRTASHHAPVSRLTARRNGGGASRFSVERLRHAIDLRATRERRQPDRDPDPAATPQRHSASGSRGGVEAGTAELVVGKAGVEGVGVAHGGTLGLFRTGLHLGRTSPPRKRTRGFGRRMRRAQPASMSLTTACHHCVTLPVIAVTPRRGA